MVKLDRDTGLVWFQSNGEDQHALVVHNKNIAFFESYGGQVYWFTLHIAQPSSQVVFSYDNKEDRDSDLNELMAALGMENHFKPAVVL